MQMLVHSLYDFVQRRQMLLCDCKTLMVSHMFAVLFKCNLFFCFN